MILPALVPLFLGALRVVGDSACPEPGDVAAALGAMAEPGWEGVARVDGAPGGTRVSLTDAAGNLVGDRLLQSSEPCPVRARAAAVILAAWQASLRGAGAPEPAPLPAERQPDLGYELGLGISGSLTADPAAVAPGMVARAAVGRERGSWRGWFEAWGEGTRGQSLGPGTVSWQRFNAGAGLSRRWPTTSAVWAELHADVLGGFVLVSGAGYAANQQSVSFDAGACGGFRGAWRTGRWVLWAGPWGCGWIRQQQAQVNGVAVSVDLPRWEVLGALGVSIASP